MLYSTRKKGGRPIYKTSKSISDYIIAMLLSNRSSYQFHKIIKERELARHKKESVSVALSRLHKNNYISISSKGWSLTKTGKDKGVKILLYSYIPSPFNNKPSTNNLISFDIPGPDRFKRDWLRNQIKIFGYKMLQQSLWLGPGPLPTEFIKRLSDLKIRDNVKIFPIKKNSSK